jgi:hypothetical protein
MGNLGIEVKIISEEYIDIKKIIIIGRWNRGTEDIQAALQWVLAESKWWVGSMCRIYERE